MAAFGNHDGVHHEATDAVAAQGGGHGGDDFGVAEHAEFHGVDAHIGEKGVELLRDEGDGDGLHAGDAPGVLRGEGGDDAGAVGAEGGERLEVGEEAGSARGIDAGDAEDIGNHAVWHGERGARECQSRGVRTRGALRRARRNRVRRCDVRLHPREEIVRCRS